NVNIGNSPTWNTNRQNVNIGGNRFVDRSRTNVNVNRSVNTVNRPINSLVNRPIYTNRPGYGYHNWHQGYWRNWNTWPAFWAEPAEGGSFIGAASSGYEYSNPYVVESPSYLVQSPALNYSQPIPAAPQVIDIPLPPDSESLSPQSQPP